MDQLNPINTKELKNFVESQLDMIKNPNDGNIPNSSEKDEQIYSIFYQEYRKSTWYSNSYIKILPTISENKYTYLLPNEYHVCSYTALEFSIPTIAVKKEFSNEIKIKLIPKYGLNITENGKFIVNKLGVQRLDSTWLDIDNQCFMSNKTGLKEATDIDIGNISLLQEWNDIIPSFGFNVIHPWYYSQDPALSYPLYFHSVNDRAYHEYEFNLLIENIIIMSRFDKNGNEIEQISNSDIHKYLVETPKEIPSPVLWANVSCLTNSEIKYYKNCNSSLGYTKKYFIKDIISINSREPHQFGKNIEEDLSDVKYPVLALFWVAKNITNKKTSYSNYSTNSSNYLEGYNPIEWTTYKYSNENEGEKYSKENTIFSKLVFKKHFPSVPSDVGYHAIAFAWDLNSFDIGRTFNIGTAKAKLICKLNDYKLGDEINFLKKESEDNIIYDNKSKINFNLRIRALITKKLIFRKKDDKFTIEIE